MFVPVSISIAAGNERAGGYERVVEMSDRFDLVADRAQDMTDPLKTVGGLLRTQMEAAFATEGATGATGAWAPLSEAYATWKAGHGGGELPLLVGLRPLRPVHHRPEHPDRPQEYETSGHMRDQLLVPLSDMATWQITPERLRFLPMSDIAGFHETGTDKMPARPPVDVGVTFLRSLDRTFVTWLNRLLREAGL